MLSIFFDTVERFLEVFKDDFSIFGDSFLECLHHLSLVLTRCKENNLTLNWRKCHYMVQQGNVLDHEIFNKGVKMDKAKVDLIANFPPTENVKDIRSLYGNAGLTIY